MRQYIDAIEKAQMRKKVPAFRAGDTVVVNVKVKEGARERIQAFEGVVIARRNRSMNSAFTVRKISHGEGVERVFQLHSPLIDSITVKRHGHIRKAKLYYLRELTGKAARIKENLFRGNKDSVNFTALAAEEAASAAQLSETAAEKAVAEAAKAEEKTEAKAEKPEQKTKAEAPKSDNKPEAKVEERKQTAAPEVKQESKTAEKPTVKPETKTEANKDNKSE